MRGSTETYRLISIKPVDASNLAISVEEPKTGKVAITGTWNISKDGKTLTYKAQNTSPDGQKTQNVRIFDKQP